MKKEELHRIPSIEVELPGEEPMDLGYKTTGRYLLTVIGLWISNDGYVLIPKNSNDNYLALTEEKIKLLKKQKMLPQDLPESPSMSFAVILKGFLWWFILLLLILFENLVRKLRNSL